MWKKITYLSTLIFPLCLFGQQSDISSSDYFDMWKNVELTSRQAKIIPAVKTGIPVWLPLSAGAGAVATTIVLLTGKDDDTNPADKPIALNDNFQMMCGVDTEINPLINDIGEGLEITTFSGAPPGVSLTDGNRFLIAGSIESSFSFEYIVTDKNRNTSRALIHIEIQFPSLNLSNQSREINSGEMLNGNILSGTICPECAVTNVTGPSGIQFIWDADGNYQIIIHNLNSSPVTHHFIFEITGKCGVSASAILTVFVIPKICTTEFATTMIPANCDMDDGSIKIENPGQDYTYIWHTGATGSVLMNVTAGTYKLTVTNATLSCTRVYEIIVPELDANYIKDVSVSPGNCYQSGKAFISISESETGPFSISASGPAGIFNFEISEGQTDIAAIIHEASGGKVITGTYALSVKAVGKADRCTERITIEIEEVPVSLTLMDDNYSATQNTTLSGNVLSNDQGIGLAVIHVNQIPGAEMTVQNNGNFNFKGGQGTYSYTYTVRDTCGRNATAMIIITVNNIVCNYQISFSITPAICGGSTGSVAASVSPADPVTFLWSTGATGPFIYNLNTGSYIVTITHPTGSCHQVFSTSVGQSEVPYLITSNVFQQNCHTKPEIILNVFGPLSGMLNITTQGPSGSYNFSIPSGNILLSNFTDLMPGIWTILIIDATAGPECTQAYSFELITYEPPILTLLDIEPPSSPIAKDGIVYVNIAGGQAPYSVAGPGQNFTNLPLGFNALKGFPSGIYTLFTVDAEGCKSNVIQVEMFGGDPPLKPNISLSSQMYFLSGMQKGPEHPTLSKLIENPLFDARPVHISLELHDVYFQIGFARNQLQEINNPAKSTLTDIHIFISEIGKKWSSNKLFAAVALRFQYQQYHITQDNKHFNLQASMYNFTIQSGMHLNNQTKINYYTDWYPLLNQWVGGSMVRLHF